MIKIKNIYYMLAYAFSVLNEEGYKKVGAEEFYYFNTEYFENIKKDSVYILMEVSRNDEVLTGAIFIKY